MRAAVQLAPALSLALGALSLGCGSGDDNGSPVPVEAGHDGTAGDGGAGDAAKPGEGGADGGEAGAEAGTLALKHVFCIMMENHAYSEIIGTSAAANAPYLNQLASQYGVASSYYGVTHPSLPNYLAAISGDFQGIFDDCAAGATVTCAPEEFVPGSGDNTMNQPLTPGQASNAAMIPHWFSGRNLVDQLEDHGLTWVAYMQSIAGVGDTSEYWPYATAADGGLDLATPRKLYAQKHDPFMYFQDVRTNAARMAKIVPFTQFATDITGASVPNFVWISPDQCHDMHGVSSANAAAVGIPGCDVDPPGDAGPSAISLGDAFVKSTVQAIMASPAWSEPSAIVIVWDEDDYAGYAGCCNSPTGADGGILGGANAPAIVIPSKNATHQTSTTPYNHYSLLGTIQKLWGLGCLGNTCGMTDAQLMTKLLVP